MSNWLRFDRKCILLEPVKKMPTIIRNSDIIFDEKKN